MNSVEYPKSASLLHLEGSREPWRSKLEAHDTCCRPPSCKSQTLVRNSQWHGFYPMMIKFSVGDHVISDTSGNDAHNL